MKRQEASILQLNIGLYCNQACSHCHVESSPKRTEMMDRATAEQCIRLLQSGNAATLDITGGAPELNSQFRYPCLSCLPQFASVGDMERKHSLAMCFLKSSPVLPLQRCACVTERTRKCHEASKQAFAHSAFGVI